MCRDVQTLEHAKGKEVRHSHSCAQLDSLVITQISEFSQGSSGTECLWSVPAAAVP
jgi:hypothetical protein